MLDRMDLMSTTMRLSSLLYSWTEGCHAKIRRVGHLEDQAEIQCNVFSIVVHRDGKVILNFRNSNDVVESELKQ